MIIRKYGLELREIEREDLEMIRQYRNSTLIRNKMIYRKIISRLEQKKWFESIRNHTNAYYLIYKDDIAMGLINGKNIDHQNKTSEGGIFIWHEDANYEVTILASIILNDWNFSFNNFNFNFAEVLKSNKKAIAYNEFMGYKISEKEHGNEYVLWMEQSKADYIKFREKVVRLKLIDFDVTEPLSYKDLIIEPSEIEFRKSLIKHLPQEQREMYLNLIQQHL